MKIYFVRHGSTDFFEQRISQPDSEPLNELGKIQTQKLAKRFSGIKLDLIISSPLTRALQTAKTITPNIEISPLFIEVKKPKEIVGISKEDENVKNISKKISEMYLADPSWHYSDEENFEDFKKRGQQALEFLISKNKENILVVSHGRFIGLMLGLMVFGETYSLDIFLRLKNFLRLNNAGVSICTYEEGKWKLQSWNDTSHCSG